MHRIRMCLSNDAGVALTLWPELILQLCNVIWEEIHILLFYPINLSVNIEIGENLENWTIDSLWGRALIFLAVSSVVGSFQWWRVSMRWHPGSTLRSLPHPKFTSCLRDHVTILSITMYCQLARSHTQHAQIFRPNIIDRSWRMNTNLSICSRFILISTAKLLFVHHYNT